MYDRDFVSVFGHLDDCPRALMQRAFVFERYTADFDYDLQTSPLCVIKALLLPGSRTSGSCSGPPARLRL